MSELKKGFVVEGQFFATKADAEEFLRTPVVLEALTVLTSDEASSKWLLENRDAILSTYKAGQIRRVSKAERKALVKALDEVTEGFLADNRDSIITSFRWPKVTRDTDSAEALKTAFVELCEGNEELADWLLATKAELEEAFNAGKPKRKVSQKALDALAEFRNLSKEEQEARRAENRAKKAAATKSVEEATEAPEAEEAKADKS
jgi:hypothetical protein